MRSRCYNKNDPSWHHYGGRGISVCDRWRDDFDAFVEDMGFAEDGQSLDRINNDKGYEPENCRWANSVEQARNKRTNRVITYQGVSKTMAEWAEDLGIHQDTLHKRLMRMSVAKSLSDGLFHDRWEHGTRRGYELKKCRCEKCRAYNAERHRKYVRAKKDKDNAE